MTADHLSFFLLAYNALAAAAIITILGGVAWFYERNFGKKTYSWVFPAGALVFLFVGPIIFLTGMVPGAMPAFIVAGIGGLVLTVGSLFLYILMVGGDE